MRLRARHRIVLLVLLLFCTWAPSAQGSGSVQPQASQVDERFDSPRSTMFTYLEAIHAVREDETRPWDQVIECFDFVSSEVDAQSEAAREVARDLWGALNHIRLVEPEELPDTDQSRTLSAFRYFPRSFDEEDDALLARAGLDEERIELVRLEDGTWKFSADTIRSAAELYAALLPLGAKVDAEASGPGGEATLRGWMPDGLKTVVFLELESWQWLGLLLLAFLGVIVDQLVRAVLRRSARLTLRYFEGAAEKKTLARFVRPAGLLAAGLTWLALTRLLGLPESAETVLLAAVRTFSILSGTWAAWRLADLVGEALMNYARSTASKFDDVLVPLLRKTAKIVATAFGLVYAAQSLQINIVPLITGLGIGGLAFAFAAKDTIENFFGSVAVILDRPFEVGDWIVIGDVEGTVEELGFRSTRVRTFYNSQITVPNSTLVRATVDNYGRRKYRRWRTIVGVQYDTSPELLVAFTEGIRELVRTHPYTRRDYFQVWCNGFGPSSIDILLYIFHAVPDWSTELRERERMLIDIVRLADQLGVQFAFPTQTVHLFKEEHADPEVRHQAPGTTSDRRAMVHGLRAAQRVVAQQPWRETKPAGVTFQAGPTDLAKLGEQDPTEATEDTRSS